MTTPEPIPEGTFVEVLNSGIKCAQVLEYRGPLGPKGARFYRLLAQRRPPLYMEVREDQLKVLGQQSCFPPG